VESARLLRFLTVYNVDVPVRAIIALSQHCTQLEKVRISGPEIGDTEVASLIARCEKLTHLDVSRTSVTELCLRAIVVD
jgi:hypothetical protein